MTREQAVAIAIVAAKRSFEATGKPSYYSEPFVPHDWVVDAILDAVGDNPIVAAIDRAAEVLFKGMNGIEHQLDWMGNRIAEHGR